MIPKGTLLIIGGAEDKGDNQPPDMEFKSYAFEHFEILKLLLKGKKRIEVITTASETQEDVKKGYQQTFKKLGLTNTGFIPIENKANARLPKFIKRIEEADAIFFSGGDQFRLSTILGGTPILDVIAKRYTEDENLVVAGTSAGAMVMSEIMINEGGKNEALRKDDLKLVSGFGLLEHCIVDTHF